MAEFKIVIQGEEHELSADVTVVGRGKDADVQVDSKALSRTHVRFTVEGDTLHIEDLGSKNGTFINGKKITEKVAYTKGDQLKLGNVEVTVKAPEPEAKPAAAAPAAVPVKNKEARKERARKDKERAFITKVVAGVAVVIIALVVYGNLDLVSEDQKEARRAVKDARALADRMETEDVDSEQLKRMKHDLERIPSEFVEEKKEAEALAARFADELEAREEMTAKQKRERAIEEAFTSIGKRHEDGHLDNEAAIREYEMFRVSYPDSALAAKAAEKVTALKEAIRSKWVTALKEAYDTVKGLKDGGDYGGARDVLEQYLAGVFPEGTVPADVKPERDKLAALGPGITQACVAAFKQSTDAELAKLGTGDPMDIKEAIEKRFNDLGFEENRPALDQALTRIEAAVARKLAEFQQYITGADTMMRERDYTGAAKVYAGLVKQAGADRSLTARFKANLAECELLAKAKQAMIACVKAKPGEYELKGFGTIATMDDKGFDVTLEGQSTAFKWKSLGDDTFDSMLAYFTERSSSAALPAAYVMVALKAGKDVAAEKYAVKAVERDASLRDVAFIADSLRKLEERTSARKEAQAVEREARAKALEEERRKRAGLGIAARYPFDKGLDKDPAVLYFMDCDSESRIKSWSRNVRGYGWTDNKENVFSGAGAMEIQQTQGTHNPSEIHPKIKQTDVAYVRWYRKWEEGYDWTQHKMPGVYARAPGVGGGGAGRKPNGTDKYSCKLYISFGQVPHFYSYHPEQKTGYGDGLKPNKGGGVIKMETGRWYCFEMMIKANNHPERDGELKMWLDGKLVAHYEGMRFRDTNDLKINVFTYSAYVGGLWSSKRDQKLWDDQIVVATKYIGPMYVPQRRR